jgi:hypothetical protein
MIRTANGIFCDLLVCQLITVLKLTIEYQPNNLKPLNLNQKPWGSVYSEPPNYNLEIVMNNMPP